MPTQQHPTTPSAAMCPPRRAARVPLFPPPGSDADGYRAWLARAQWPEAVFGARLPEPASRS